MDILSFIANICGILGLVFSLAIWRSARNIKAQVNAYRRNQKDIVTKLKANRESMFSDGLYTIGIRSGIRTELYSILKNYSSILTITEKLIIRKTARVLTKTKRDKINMEKLCRNLDYIIARFNKKEIEK